MNIAHISQRLAGVHMTSCNGNPCDYGAIESPDKSGALLLAHQERAAQLKCSMLMMENSVGLLGKTQTELNERIYASIARCEEALQLKRDRRKESEPVENEKRDGFDRRARVTPAKE